MQNGPMQNGGTQNSAMQNSAMQNTGGQPDYPAGVSPNLQQCGHFTFASQGQSDFSNLIAAVLPEHAPPPSTQALGRDLAGATTPKWLAGPTAQRGSLNTLAADGTRNQHFQTSRVVNLEAATSTTGSASSAVPLISTGNTESAPLETAVVPASGQDPPPESPAARTCLLYTSDAADE